MKKFIKILFVLVVVLVGIGYGIYYFGTNFATEKFVDELENSGQLETAKQFVENDQELQHFLAEAKNVDPDQLPFTSKEEAIHVVLEKVGISEINNLQSRAQEGTLAKEEILQSLQENLTDQEILALKVVIYNELY